MSTLSAIMMMAGVAVAGSVHAASPAAMGVLDQHALAFVKTPGRQVVDADLLAGEKYYTPQRFPKQAGLSMPDADLDAVTKSILLLESLEPPLPRVRYLVTYNVVSPPDYPDFQRELVEVTRFNMGPTLRLDLADSVPQNHQLKSFSLSHRNHPSLEMKRHWPDHRLQNKCQRFSCPLIYFLPAESKS